MDNLITAEELNTKLDDIARNPVEVVRLIQNRMVDLGGTPLTMADPTNPLMIALECLAAEASNLIDRNGPLERRLYPANAETPEDVYLHRSDADFIGVFSAPGKSSWLLSLSLDEVIQKAVPVPGTDNRKITIPRNTQFHISETNFGIHYPIDIIVGPQDGISVLYDTSVMSPMQQLASNTVGWSINIMDGMRFLLIRIPAEQFTLVNNVLPADNSSGFNRNFSFTDRFYHCRVFQRSTENEMWEEISTTHTEQVHDPNIVTAVLKVTGSNLSVVIPQQYFNNNMVKSSVRVDIYTTLGDVDMEIGGFLIGEYNAEWRDFNYTNANVYTAPLVSFSSAMLYAIGQSTGGSNGMSFRELRDQVIWNNSGNISIPITMNQLDNQVSLNGFNIVRNLDAITNRQFWATRQLPPPNSDDGVAPAACAMELLATSITELRTLDTVGAHDQRVTIYPNTLYRLENGVLSLAETGLEAYIRALSAEDRAAYLNSANLFYSPFYYVLDISNQNFETRPYDLEQTTAENIYFIEQNDLTQMSFSTRSYSLSPDGSNTGFYLDIVARCNNNAQNYDASKIKLQLSYQPPLLTERVYMTETPLGGAPNDDGDYVFRFHIESTMDVDSDHNIILNSFLYVNNDPRQLPAPLRTTMDLVYLVEDWWPTGTVQSNIDAFIGQAFLDSSIFIGVSHETMDLVFGHHLSTLWTRSRTIKVDVEYLRYENDVPAIYSEDVYEMDPLTGLRKGTYNPSTQRLEFNKLHSAGDPVLDENNDPVMAHLAGDVVLDSQGNPVPATGPYDLIRHTDILLVDGRYYFATSQTTTEYRTSYTEAMLSWIMNDIADIQRRVLEETEIFFYPTKLAGSINATIDEGVQARMKTAQSIQIRATMTNENYQNQTLRASIERRTVNVIQENFSRQTVDVSSIIEQARAVLGQDVLGIDILGIFDDVGTTVATIENASRRFTIAKRANALADGTIAVQDDVTLIPINHSAGN